MNIIPGISALVVCLLVFAGCKEHDNSTEAFQPVFSAVINGSAVSITGSNGHIFGCGSSMDPQINGTDSSMISFRISCTQFYKPDSVYHNSIFITFANHIPVDILDSSTNPPDLFEPTFRSLLKVGEYYFTADTRKKAGVVVTWYDNNGILWVSGKHSSETYGVPITEPNYANSHLQIVSSKSATPPNNFSTWSQEIKINFNCTLYNHSGDSLTLSSGLFNAIYSYHKQ